MSEKPKTDDKPKGGRKHEGWIRERDGIQYAYFKHRGRRYVESARSSRVGDAQRVLDRMKREIPKGIYISQRDRTRLERQQRDQLRADARALEFSTVEKLVEVWLATKIATYQNAKGQKQAASRAKTYLIPFMGDRSITDVTPDLLCQYRLWLEQHKNEFGRKLNVQTVRHILSAARSFFSWATEAKHIAASPVPRLLLPKVPEKEPKALSDDEAAAVATIADPYGFACRVMLGTGVRWGELIQLKASDVRDGMLVLTAPKTGRLRRIPLHPALLAEIKRHIGKLVPWTGDPGYQLTLKLIRRLSGVKAYSHHRCRHSFAFRWVWNGGSLSALSAVLGHSSVAMTEIYARTTDALVRREAERTWDVEKVGTR